MFKKFAVVLVAVYMMLVFTVPVYSMDDIGATGTLDENTNGTAIIGNTENLTNNNAQVENSKERPRINSENFDLNKALTRLMNGNNLGQVIRDNNLGQVIRDNNIGQSMKNYNLGQAMKDDNWKQVLKDRTEQSEQFLQEKPDILTKPEAPVTPKVSISNNLDKVMRYNSLDQTIKNKLQQNNQNMQEKLEATVKPTPLMPESLAKDKLQNQNNQVIEDKTKLFNQQEPFLINKLDETTKSKAPIIPEVPVKDMMQNQNMQQTQEKTKMFNQQEPTLQEKLSPVEEIARFKERLQELKNQNYEQKQLIQEMKQTIEELKTQKKKEALKEVLEEAIANAPKEEQFYKEYGKNFNSQSLTLFANGKRINLQGSPVIKEGRTLIPLRDVAETLGAKVNWNPDKKMVVINKGDIEINLNINNSEASVNGKKIKLDVPAQVYNNKTMVPLRFVAEALKTKVNYYKDGNITSIIDDSSLEQAAEASSGS